MSAGVVLFAGSAHGQLSNAHRACATRRWRPAHCALWRQSSSSLLLGVEFLLPLQLQPNHHRLAIPSNVIRPSVEMPGCPSKNVRSALSMRREQLSPWQTPLEWGDGVAAPRCSAARKWQHGCGGWGFACLIEPRNHLYDSAHTLVWSPCLHGSHSPEWGWRRVCDRPTIKTVKVYLTRQVNCNTVPY